MGADIIVEASLTASIAGFGVWDVAVWDDGIWGPDDVWTDISPWVRAIKIDRRFARHLQVWESGTATVELNNPDARFSGTNLSGPYVAAGMSMIRALRPIRIRAVYGGVTYPLYAGHADSWDETWLDGSTSIVTVPCQDVWSLLGTDGEATSSAGAGESFGARVHRWLDSAGYLGRRDVVAGDVTMQATDLSSRPVDGLRLTAESEGGAIWVDADGTIVGEHRYALIENDRSIEVQATFGDGSGPPSIETPCSDMKLAWRSEFVKNHVSFARVGGTPQVHADLMSQAISQAILRETRTDLICQTDLQVDQLAAWYLAQYKDDEQTFSSIELKPLNPALASIIPTILGIRMRDLVRCIRRPPAGDVIDKHCHIAGIHHTIGDDWTTTFDLWSATKLLGFSTSRWDAVGAVFGASDSDPTAARWFY